MTIELNKDAFDRIAYYMEGKDEINYLSTCKALYTKEQTQYLHALLKLLLTRKFEPKHIARALTYPIENGNGTLQIEKIREAIAGLYTKWNIFSLRGSFPFERDQELSRQVLTVLNYHNRYSEIQGFGVQFASAERDRLLEVLAEKRLSLGEVLLEITNPLDDTTAQHIAEALRKGAIKVKLSLEYTSWTLSQLLTIVEGLKQNQTIKEVRLSGSSFPKAECNRVKALLKPLFSIRENFFSNSGWVITKNKSFMEINGEEFVIEDILDD